ncbi:MULTISPECIES: tRNA (guanine-N1)-methyltransferase [Arenibacter]|uniref:tRNA (guanine-N1)-methyltransferase n=1 Tax=Arenibacter TaxID=178469 RepID=UPI000A367C53|nr:MULTISPECIES: tRNA (guanine-N1)-methyltransferase [Arenibacter]
MKLYRILVVVLALWSCNLSLAQDGEEQEVLSLDGGPISSQFEYLTTKSGPYRAEGIRYRVVKEVNLNKLRKNVSDSINEFNERAAQLRTTIASHEETIESLNKQLEETTNNLAAVTEEKDNMSFLGFNTSKGTYNAILWTIIGSLLLLLLFFIYKFRNSNILTQEAKQSLSEVEKEYEDHRRRALEREQKISRQLQDEINKYKKS